MSQSDLSRFSQITYKDLILYRVEVWWKRPPTKDIHSKRECTKTLTLDLLRDKKNWFCCPYWRRKFSNKYNTRLLAQLLEVPMAKLYWHGKNPKDIPFLKLPQNYVIRPTSGASSQGVFVVKNGFDLKSSKNISSREIIKKLVKYQNKHPYTNFLVEQFVATSKGEYTVPVDYKIHMFCDRVAFIQRVSESDHKRGRHKLYTEDWTPLPVLPERYLECYKEDRIHPPPKDLDKMLTYARRLGKVYDHYIRVDFFQTDNGPIFCEFTPTPCLGLHVTQTGNKYLMNCWNRMCPDKYMPPFLE